MTTGLLLLSLSFSFIAIDDECHGTDMVDASQELIQSLMHESFPNGLIEYSSLDGIDLSRIIERFDVDHKIILQEIGTNHDIVLADTGAPYIGGERGCSSLPICVRHSTLDVRAALLTVWVW